MAFDLLEKIEHIRRQPEHVRRRYVLVCLAVSMAFIIGIWMLSLREGFRSVAKELPEAAEKGKELLPPKEGVPSLNDLMEQAAPLRIENGKEMTGQEFFQEQYQDRSADQSERGQ